MSGTPAVTDSREVRVDVADVDPVYTPKGARPIEPKWVRIHYAIDPASRAVTSVWVEVGGTPIGDWAKTRRHPDAYLRRRWEYDPATASRWLADLVAQHRPGGEPDQATATARTGQMLDAGALIRAADKARRSWDRDDVIDYAHGVAHYLHRDEGVSITVHGAPIDPGTLSLAQWRRLVRDNDLAPND